MQRPLKCAHAALDVGMSVIERGHPTIAETVP